MNRWTVKILGQNGTPYRDGVFIARLKFPSDYPFRPPSVKFRTKIYHPNIAPEGDVCSDLLLQENWCPNLNIWFLLESFRLLLEAPNGNVIVNEEAGDSFNSNRAEFASIAEQWTRKHATHSGRMWRGHRQLTSRVWTAARVFAVYSSQFSYALIQVMRRPWYIFHPNFLPR